MGVPLRLGSALWDIGFGGGGGGGADEVGEVGEAGGGEFAEKPPCKDDV